MPTEFYFEIQYFNFDWKIAVTHLRESGFYEFKKNYNSHSNQCNSESESATARFSHSTVVST